MAIHSVVVELIDVCNLSCSYCLRDEASLHGKAHALPIADLRRILAELRTSVEDCQVVFTGGEPTLHPEFRNALKAVQELGWRCVVVTNGWNFRRILPAVLEFRESLQAMAFSFSGLDREEHDCVRGKGSFHRLMEAVASCRHHGLPFRFKMTVDRPKAGGISGFAMFAARLGAEVLEVAPLLPANVSSRADVMSAVEQEDFLREIGLLRETLKMPVHIAAGFFDPRPEPGCGPLLGTTLNVDYNARLTLCTVLAGFRAQPNDRDVIADLRSVSLPSALPHFEEVVEARNRERLSAFSALRGEAARPPLRLGSSCFDCLCSFGKMLPDPFDSPEEKAPMDDSATFSVAESIITSEFDGKEALLLDTASQRYYTLNETATFLWAAIEKGRTVAEMVAALRASFEVEEERARASVIAALTRLESQHLISRVSLASEASVASFERVQSR
jgi:MoaA/NifB/PqqE/SkfB family radical SAM enzyme